MADRPRRAARARAERAAMLLTPFLAMGAVALGLRAGAGGPLLAARVMAAPSSGGRSAWQVVAFAEDHGNRSPLAGAPLRVLARAGGRAASAAGRTNADGVFEANLDLSEVEGASLEVWTNDTPLAEGNAAPEPADIVATRSSRTESPWMPFARRTGAIAMDVTVLGSRAAPGFATTVCVHATDSATHLPVPGARIARVPDSSLFGPSVALTDFSGWATLTVVPVGLALSLDLEAKSSRGGTGVWSGGLVAAPGGASIETPTRVTPGEAPRIDLVLPRAHGTEYLEIDDRDGRLWAQAIDIPPAADTAQPSIRLPAPVLPPGLYWVLASSTPDGPTWGAPGLTTRPFFVAGTDDEALAIGAAHGEGVDPRDQGGACDPRNDRSQEAAALLPCLAVSSLVRPPRWLALDGAPPKREARLTRRARGLWIALSALAMASLLEAVLVARAASRAGRAGTWRSWDETGASRELEGERGPGGPGTSIVLGLLIALLGFALLAAFLVRAG